MKKTKIESEMCLLIEEINKTLIVLRQKWMLSHPSSVQAWMNKIDTALEERYRLMGLRDQK